MNTKSKQSIYDFSAKTIDGQSVSLNSFRGKTMLFVNVASYCGFTKQYSDLEILYKNYKDKGLVVLAFPCNQFGSQEPESDSEIKKFCSINYQVSFPLFAKVLVNGTGEHPLYTFLKQEKLDDSGLSDIQWNFTKFLVSPTGEVLKRYAPQISPTEIAKELTI